MLRCIWSTILILMFTEIPSKGQSESQSTLKKAVIVEKLTLPITFDGIPDDEAWNTIIPIKMIMYSPFFGKDPTEETDVRIAYDDTYLYVAAWLRYQNPEMIRSTSLKRDYMGMTSDLFGILLDTYNDKENCQAYMTSPDALRWDASIQKDAVIQRPSEIPMNINWNTFWDVQTNIDKNGWSVEMRIPFSSLRFQDSEAEVRMGLIIQRWMPVKNETDIFPAIPPNWGQYSIIKPSQAQEIVLKDIKPDKPIYIAPYLLGGYVSHNDLKLNQTEYIKSNKLTLEGGLDIKFGLSNNMIMDLTVNTDFAQVEADELQINLTRNALYLPEKRMFFLERESVFDYSYGWNSMLFYSRRIGLSDDGDPIRIYGGTRISGRVGKWDMGVLDMQTAAFRKIDSSGVIREILPSENFGVVRFRRQVINENSFVGAMVTSRIGIDGSYNLAYGLDGLFRIYGEDYLNLKWSQSFEDNLKNISILDPSRIQANWQRQSNRGLSYELGYARSGLNFNPGIGFELLDNYYSIAVTLNYGWLPEESSPIYSHSPVIALWNAYYVDDGSIMSSDKETGWKFTTKNQWQGSFDLHYDTENLRDSLEIIENEVFIPPSKYNFIKLLSSFSTPGSKSFYITMKPEIGQYYDGTRFSINIQPTLILSKHLELGALYNLDKLNFSRRNVRLTNHIIGIKPTYMIDTRLSLNAYFQYNTSEKIIRSNIRFRYNPKEGNDFYIVFNSGRNTAITREFPHLPVYSVKSLLLKYNYTFNL